LPEIIFPLPLGRLAELAAEGAIGELATDVISFSGYQPDVTRVLDETIPLFSRLRRMRGPMLHYWFRPDRCARSPLD
jgi:hypothetical protein